jgi:hypothetical protein
VQAQERASDAGPAEREAMWRAGSRRAGAGDGQPSVKR